MSNTALLCTCAHEVVQQLLTQVTMLQLKRHGCHSLVLPQQTTEWASVLLFRLETNGLVDLLFLPRTPSRPGDVPQDWGQAHCDASHPNAVLCQVPRPDSEVD